MRQLFNLTLDREGKEQKALKISLLYSRVMVVNHSQTKLVAVRLTGRMKTGCGTFRNQNKRLNHSLE